MRWRTRNRSFLEQSNHDSDTIDISKPISSSSFKPADDPKKATTIKPSLKKQEESTSLPPVPPTGGGFLGALDKVKEPRFLSSRKEKRNNIKLNL